MGTRIAWCKEQVNKVKWLRHGSEISYLCMKCDGEGATYTSKTTAKELRKIWYMARTARVRKAKKK